MSRFYANRDPLQWDDDAHLQRRDRNDPAREIALMNRLLNPGYVANANSGKPEAVLKIVSNAMGKGALSNVVEYIARTADYMEDEQPLDLEDEQGRAISTKEERKGIINDWGEDFEAPSAYKDHAWKVELRKQLDYERARLQYYDEKRGLDRKEQKRLQELNRALKKEKLRQPDGTVTDFHIYAPKDTTHIILSIGGQGHDTKAATQATRQFLTETFGAQGYRYMFVMHDDTDNLHFHVIVKNKNELTLKNLQFDRADLFALRHEFAWQLDRHGIERVATLRRDRVVTLKSILEQKEELYERRDWFDEKMHKLKTGEESKSVNVLKHRQTMLKRTDYLLRNIGTELEYSVLDIKRARELKATQKELRSFRKQLLESETSLSPEDFARQRDAAVSKLLEEGRRLQKKETWQDRPAASTKKQKPGKAHQRRRSKNTRLYLKAFEQEITEAIKHYKRQGKAMPLSGEQKERNAAAVRALGELQNHAIRLRKSKKKLFGPNMKITH